MSEVDLANPAQAFWFLAVLVGLPALPLYFVDVERGKAAGSAMAHELEGRESVRPSERIS